MKRTIKFNLFPKKIGGVLVECRPIRMRVCYAGYRVDFRVGYSIEPENGITKKAALSPIQKTGSDNPPAK